MQRSANRTRFGIVVGRHSRWGKPPIVFCKADTHQFSGADLGAADDLAAVHCEVVVLCVAARVAVHAAGKADTLPSQEDPDGADAQLEPWPPVPRHRAPTPRYPIGKQQNVTAFFLDDRFERIDQFGRKEAGPLGQLEQAEGEEAVDALAEASNSRYSHSVSRGSE